MIHIIISMKGIQKISDRLYIRVCTFNKFIIILQKEQQVPDKWRDACILRKFD